MIQAQAFIDKLVEDGTFSSTDADHVLNLVLHTNEPIDQIIGKLGLMAEHELARHYASYKSIPITSQNIEPLEETAQLNPEYLSANRVMPYRHEDGTLFVGMVDPLDNQGLSAIAFSMEAHPKPSVMTHSHWEQLYAQLHHDEDPHLDVAENDITADAARLLDLASTEPVIKLVNKLIDRAASLRASDIHIEPSERDAQVRFRIDGLLELQETLSSAQCLSVISRIKILAELDIAERRRPQDGSLSFPVAGRAIDLRVSTIPTDHGESAVLRLLDKKNVNLNYHDLGYQPQTIEVIRRILNKPHGIVLVTGPTGSGKTTTLYTFLKELATEDRKILTIEDPIEYKMPGVSQSQVNSQIDVTFATALRSFLRHDPDVMMVGEIRDAETANIAIQAALTGHLVLSTLHTNDAPSAITRLRDLGIEDYLIASTIIGVVGQRLVRRLCPDCQDIDPLCKTCNGTGHAGRTAVVEVLEIDIEVQQKIRTGECEQAIMQSASHFRPMYLDGDLKVSTNQITREDLIRTLGKANAGLEIR